MNCDISNNEKGANITFSKYPQRASKDNIIYHNNFIANIQNAYDDRTNFWDYNGEDNYWSDYSGIDANGDGISDDSYYIPGGNNKDNYPLTQLYLIRRNVAVLELPKFETAVIGVRISSTIINDGKVDVPNFSKNEQVREGIGT